MAFITRFVHLEKPQRPLGGCFQRNESNDKSTTSIGGNDSEPESLGPQIPGIVPRKSQSLGLMPATRKSWSRLDSFSTLYTMLITPQFLTRQRYLLIQY